MKNILALDLGTKTGYCYNNSDLGFDCGTWLLASDKLLKATRPTRMDRRNDPRIHELFRLLEQKKSGLRIDVLVFEDVRFSTYTMQTQLWSSLRAAVWLAFPPCSGVNVECIDVGTLKKFSTGHGGATKPMMEKYLKLRHPGIYRTDLDDNAVDAAWLWVWASEHLCKV